MAAAHITTIGVRRPGEGRSGMPLDVQTNHFRCRSPDAVISHYDVIQPSEKVLPARLNMDIITRLQTHVAPDVFTPRVVYDGRKNIFAPRKLSFGRVGEFDVTLTDARTVDPKHSPYGGGKGKDKDSGSGRGPKVYKVKLTKVAEINPEVLLRFLDGKQSHDNTVLTAITALNVVIRMEPTIKYPFNVRSFFTDRETKDIGGGMILWRGYFQSVRPAAGRLLINVDISTGTMYKSGSLLDLCLDFINRPRRPDALTERGGFPDRERIRLQRFIMGIRIVTPHLAAGGAPAGTPRVVKSITKMGSSQLTFRLREGGQMTVANYFINTYNKRLQFPELPCVEVGSGALIPLELCVVPPGQIMRKQVPPEKTKAVLEFATMKPEDRMRSIKNGVSVLAYGKSDYVRQFGMSVEASPCQFKARVIAPPTLKFGAGGKQEWITPALGSWNMFGKKFYAPAVVNGWIVVCFETTLRFNELAVKDMIQGLRDAATAAGIKGLHTNPIFRYVGGQNNIKENIVATGRELRDKTGVSPTLIIAVIPEGATDIYTQIKHVGDCVIGVATQCLKSGKCFRAKPQYWANVCLKINVKLGGINTIPDSRSVPFLSDPTKPTIVIGADVIHPAPGADGRPSFTALVASMDGDTSKYVATSHVQTSRQEMIDDLEQMSYYLLDMYMKYRRIVMKKSAKDVPPQRILFYRDGVSEGQFKAVLDTEIPRIKAACRAHKIPLPKITFIVVGKRHHVRFFPSNPKQADKSGNCPAGTVVDTAVTHPTEFDFYLQSHGGLLGTSRPAHYNVLLDENTFNADSLQQLTFALTHVYARATRSVSIPAPVYYADLVCARAKCRYPPTAGFDLSDGATQLDPTQARHSLELFKEKFQPLKDGMRSAMYFS